MTITTDIVIEGDSEFAATIARQIMQKSGKNPPQEVFARALRRSLAKTGSETTKKIKQFFKDGKNNFAPNRVHSLHGLVVQTMAAKNKPFDFYSRKYSGKKAKKVNLDLGKKKRTPPGGRFGRMMEYLLDEQNGQWVRIGLIPERRGFGWDKKFANWQEAGRLDFSDYNNGNNFFAMMKYTRAIGIPLTKWPVRPARPVISKIDAMYNPSAMFEQFFLERLGG